MAQANWRSADDVGNYDKGRPGAPPRVFDYTRWRKDWVKVSIMTVEPKVPRSATWSTRLVMPAHHATDEFRHKYK